MKTARSRIYWLIVLFQAASLTATPGATYYIDFEGGNDAGSGTSTNDAWQHCPGDVNATATAGAATLGPGDQVLFKGGVSYLGSIRLRFNGGVDQRIIYDGNSSGQWGSGRAILDGEQLNLAARRYGFVVDTAVQDVEIRNFEIRRLGGVPDLQNYDTNSLPYSPGYGIYLRDATRVHIADCFFHELGTWTNGLPNNTKTGLGGFGIFCFGAEDLTVERCEFTRMEKGIRISPGQYGQMKQARRVRINACNFHHYMRWLVELSTSAHNTGLDDVTVSHCSFHDFTEFDNGRWKGGGAYPHTDGLILGVSNYTNRNYGRIQIKANCFYQNATNGGGTAMIFMTGMGGHVQIFNNVFINVLHSLGSIYVQDGPREGVDTPLRLQVVNNTFFDKRYAVYLRTLTAGHEVNRSNIEIQNNIFYKASTDAAFSVVVHDTNSAPRVLDNNGYYTPRTDGLLAQIQGPLGKEYATLALLRERWGWETNGLVADPRFRNTQPGLGYNSSRNELKLAMGSPYIGRAVAVEGIKGEEPCAEGPAVANTSLGAYQAIKPNPPTNLRAVR